MTATIDRGDFARTTVEGLPRWVASADFTVNVLHDTADESIENFTVRLAFVGSRQPHLTLGQSTATVTTTDDVASLADLGTSLNAYAGTIEPGDQLTYDWSVTNSGPAAATNTVLTGTLAEDVTFVSAQVASPATGQCRQSGRRVSCTLGTLDIGETVTGDVVIEVVDNASGDVRFTAAAGADQVDRTPADNDDFVITELIAAPRRITDLRATGASGHIDVTWSTPGDNGSVILRYELERKTGSDDFAFVSPQPLATATAYRDEGVSAGAEYTYRLRAVNTDGEAEWSNESMTSLLDPVLPPTITGGGGGGGFGPAPVAPKFGDGFRTTRNVAQNARAGDAVGDAVSATHPDDLDIAYSLSGTDAASFTVEEETGQIRVKEGVELELGRTYMVNLTATDSAGVGAIIIVVINVTEASHHRYDLDQDGNIERVEVVAAVKDYFDGLITKDDVIELVKMYFAESG